jgi:alkaline phosphatase D
MTIPFRSGGRSNGAKPSRAHRRWCRPRLVPALEILEPRLILSALQYTAVAAGDPTSDGAILWTRALDSQQPQSLDLLAEVSTDPSFGVINAFYLGRTDPDRDYTVKVPASGLQSGTQYYYRFLTYLGQASPVGRFTTAPDPTAAAPLHFGFSGDADGAWRPYDVTANFADQAFDFFIFLGDTIYEGSNARSAGTGNPYEDPAGTLKDFRRKYRENLEPVNPGGFSSLQTFFASQGNYTLLDNHELGNKQFQSGGAPAGSPPGKGADSTDPQYDVNATGTFMNKTPGFRILSQAYRDYQPIRERLFQAPNDLRIDQTYQLYFSQQWGQHDIFFNLDDRSYRDIRMTKPGGSDDTGPRADNPDRTMLGLSQLQWIKQGLLDAQANNISWKFVAISSPIDETLFDNGKTWNGGYRAEREELLKFIADKHIDHVIFLTTDDHVVRVNEVNYLTDPKDPTSRARIPGCFSIVAGPLGAAGPDGITNHSFNNIRSQANSLAAKEIAQGLDPVGLDPAFPGLHDVYREGDPDADSLRQPADFYSPDTFNYVTLDISQDSSNLTVSAFGIDSYPANTFLEPDQVGPERLILSFQVSSTIGPTGPAAAFAFLSLSAGPWVAVESAAQPWHTASTLRRQEPVAMEVASVDRFFAAANREQGGWHDQQARQGRSVKASWQLVPGVADPDVADPFAAF